MRNRFLFIVSVVALCALASFSVTSLFVGHQEAPKAGTSLVTLNGGDNIKNFPTVYNSNNTALNNGKVEVGTTSVASILSLPNLSTVGTISSGVWQANIIAAAYGGTATSSPTLNQLMFGNGSSGLKVIGFGNSGQSLVSNGPGVIPAWQSVGVDQSGTFNWTGPHTFNATTSMATSTVASTTIGTLNVTGAVSGIVDYQVFTANGTWTKPGNLTGNELVIVDMWGGGGAGGGISSSAGDAGGGGGGAFIEGKFRASDLTSTVSVSVAASASGGTGNGSAGNNSTFGSYVTIYGGGGGAGKAASSGGGAGGGTNSAGGSSTSATNGTGGDPFGGTSGADSLFGGGGGQHGSSVYGGGGGGKGGVSFGGNSVYGGGGGGASNGIFATGGTSVFGGAGGNSAASGNTAGGDGVVPGGGGGAAHRDSSGTSNGGAGARGEVRVWVMK